jgi:hypothetical protein
MYWLKDGKLRNCEFSCAISLKAAERQFKALHPNAVDWQIGIPDEHLREALHA